MSDQNTTASERQRRVAEAARQVAIATGAECPDCASTAQHEDNGCTGRWLEYRCVACDHRWGPGAEA
jgi:transposase-like protein